MKVTACTNLISYLYFCQSLVLSPLTFKQFEFQMKLDQNQCLDMIFRTSGPWNLETFIRTSDLQNLWHLVFRIFKSSEAGDVHQNFRSSESWALDQKRNIRSWTVHQNFLSQNLQLGFWANDQNLQKLTCIRIRNSVFRSASEWNFLGF